LLGIARRDGAASPRIVHRVVAAIEPQAGLPLGAIGAMAAEASVRENRPNVAVVLDSLVASRPSSRDFQRGQQHDGNPRLPSAA